MVPRWEESVHPRRRSFFARLGRSRMIPVYAQPVPEDFTASHRGGRPAWMRDGLRAALCAGGDDLEVVGESRYQDSLWSLAGTDDRSERIRISVTALLVPETDNPHDPQAVAVWVDGLKVGHLSRADARLYRPGILALHLAEGCPVAVPGVITGGGLAGDRKGLLGVFLSVDREQFQVPR